MSDAERVLLTTDGAIATVTLNRPDAMNALDDAMVDGLHAALVRIECDPAVRCVVLCGAGDNFMAGGDIRMFAKALAELGPAERQVKFEGLIGQVHASVTSLRRMGKPVIGSVQGAVAGFGVSLATACDLTIAADNAIFTLAYCHIGTSPDGGSTFHLPRAVGMKRAMEIAMLGNRFGAAEAAAIGLINRVVPAAELQAETAKLAARLAHGPTAAYGRTKALLNASLDNSLAAQLAAESELFTASTMTEDFREGVTAFLEKRRASFQGADRAWPGKKANFLSQVFESSRGICLRCLWLIYQPLGFRLFRRAFCTAVIPRLCEGNMPFVQFRKCSKKRKDLDKEWRCWTMPWSISGAIAPNAGVNAGQTHIRPRGRIRPEKADDTLGR